MIKIRKHVYRLELLVVQDWMILTFWRIAKKYLLQRHLGVHLMC